MTAKTRIWGIHAGRSGEADDLFLGKGLIGLGWEAIGDLSRLDASREAFKAAVEKAYPNKKAGAIPNNAGQLYRLVHEMAVGDYVVYPSKRDRLVHIGRVTGPYRHETSTESIYPQRRPVEWLKAVPRSRFSQGALYEIGSAMSLFRVKTYAQEFLDAVGDAAPKPVAAEDDETVTVVAENIEESTSDFVLKRLAEELKGHPFSHFVAHLLNAMGYRTRVSPEGPDGGIDIIAHKDELGFEPPIIKVQVKSGEGTVGDPALSSLYGKVGPKEFGLLVTLGSVTAPAKAFARSRENLRIIEGTDLVELIFEHYEKFDSQYKSIIPLKRVYVPAPQSDDE